MTTEADARAAGFVTPTGTDLIRDGDDAITRNAIAALDEINRARFTWPFTGSTTGDLNALTAPGAHAYWSTWDNRPSNATGTVVVLSVGAGLTQVAITYGQTSELWRRYRGGDGRTWSAWTRLDASASTPAATGGASSTAFRTVPLALTVGGGAFSWSDTSGGVRIPVKFGADITRWRVHFRNINPRDGLAQSATVTIGGVRFGRVGSQPHYFAANPLIAQNLSGSGDLVTPWQTTPIPANTPHLLGFSWSSTAPTRGVVGGGWTTAPGGQDYGANIATVTATASMPLDVWIEAEVSPDVPVVAAFGDSLSSGVGATQPVYDSWLSQYCRQIGALPVHYTASGDGLIGWQDAQAYKVTRWQHLSAPDALINVMGSNDVFSGSLSLADMQSRHAGAMAVMQRICPTIYAAKLLPRTSQTGAAEDTRRAYNAWLSSQHRDVFDFITPVSADDENIAAADTTDGTHLTTLGYAKLANAIARPVVPTRV